MEVLPLGAAFLWRTKGSWRGVQTLVRPWPCTEDVIAQMACYLLQGFRDVALELPHPHQDHYRAVLRGAVSKGPANLAVAELALICPPIPQS